MQITDILAQMGGLKSMAQELGVDEAQAASSAAALAPAILGGFKKQAQSQPTGLEGFGGLPGELGGGGRAGKGLAPQPDGGQRGEHVFPAVGVVAGAVDEQPRRPAARLDEGAAVPMQVPELPTQGGHDLHSVAVRGLAGPREGHAACRSWGADMATKQG